MRQLGTERLQGLCRSGAQGKRCTSAPLSVARSQQNEAKVTFQSRRFAFEQAALPPRAAHEEHALILTCCEHRGDVWRPVPQCRSQRAEHWAGLLFQKVIPVVQWWILLSQPPAQLVSLVSGSG